MCTKAVANLTADKNWSVKNSKGESQTQRVINLNKLNVTGSICLDQKEILANLN